MPTFPFSSLVPTPPPAPIRYTPGSKLNPVHKLPVTPFLPPLPTQLPIGAPNRSGNFIQPTNDFRGLYVDNFRWMIPQYAFNHFSDAECPYSSNFYTTKYSLSLSNVKKHVLNVVQPTFLNWLNSTKVLNYFNALSLYTGGMLDEASTNVAKLGYNIRREIAAFNKDAYNRGVGVITSVESNELFFVPETIMAAIDPYNAAATLKYPILKTLNPKRVKNTSKGGSTVSYFNEIDALIPPERFTSVQLEQDWWRFDGTCANPSVGFDKSRPWNQSDASASNIYFTAKSWHDQMSDIRGFIKKPFPFVQGFPPSLKRTKNPNDLEVETYVARPNSKPITVTPAQSQMDFIVDNSDRIILANASSSALPDYSYYNTFNQLALIADRAKRLSTPTNIVRVPVVVLLYCNIDYNMPNNHPLIPPDDVYTPLIPFTTAPLYNYFRTTPFHLGYDYFLQQYYNEIILGNVSTEIQDHIFFVGYQIFSYTGAYNARH
ncbi:MAG: hypothetical protein NTX03_03790 [Bacteroidetes bacterium]|nr:hypothetical protein [Bacteroidota bacterium]